MSYIHLTIEKRSQIEVLRREGYSVRRIASLIGVHHSTVARELNRVEGEYSEIKVQQLAISKSANKGRPTLGYAKDLASFYSGYKGAMSFHNWNYQRKMNNMMFDTLTSYDLNTYLTMREGFGLGAAALGGKLGRTIEEKIITAVGGGKVLDDVTKDAYNKVVTNVPIKSNEDALIERMDKLINESKAN